MSAIRKTFLSNLMLIIGLNLLIKPLYILVIEARVQDRVGPEEFGVYFALLNLSFIFNILPDLGITNWNTREVAAAGIIDTKRFHRLLGVRSILALIYVVICCTMALTLHYSTQQVFMLAVLSFNQVLSTGLQFMRSYIAGLHRFRIDSIFSVLDRALLAAIMAALLIVTPESEFKIDYLIWGQSIAYGIAFVAALFFVVRNESNAHQISSLSYLNILRESAPYALLILLSMIANRADGVLLERLSGRHEAGIYAMAYRLGDTLNMFSFLFAGLLLPMFTKQLRDRTAIQLLFQNSFQLLTVGAGLVLTACLFHSKYLLQFIYSTHVSEAAVVLPWVMLSAFFFSLQYITGTLITASGRMSTLIFIAACGLIYNAALNLLYIPEQGALGAAKAACFMQFIIWMAQCFEVQKQFRVFQSDLILRSCIFIFITLAIGYFLNTLALDDSLQLTLTIGACAVAALGCKMIRLSEIKHALALRSATDQHEHQKH